MISDMVILGLEWAGGLGTKPRNQQKLALPNRGVEKKRDDEDMVILLVWKGP